MPVPFRLHVITNRYLAAPAPLSEIVHKLLDNGVRWFQIREKDLPQDELASLALPLVEKIHGYDGTVSVNSSVPVARETGTDGIHLPERSQSVEDIRSDIPWSILVGCSVHSHEQALLRQEQGADYLVYSPVFPTASKPGYGPAKGVSGVRELARKIDIPVLALGGITPPRVVSCLQSGAAGVAVMSTLMVTPEKAGEYLEQCT